MSDLTTTETKTVLIVDDEKPVVKALSARCEQLGLQVEQAYDAAEALRIIHSSPNPPDLLLLDFSMPGADGLTLCDVLRTNVALPPIPVILLTGYENDETRRRCEEVGAHYVKKDVKAWQVLQPLVCRLLNIGVVPIPNDSADDQRGAQADSPPADAAPSLGKVLVIDDDTALCKTLRVRFEKEGYTVFTAYTGMQGYWMALKEEPDIVILDYKMPEGWGNLVLGKLKTNPLTESTPVIILSGLKDLGIQRDVVRLGAERWVEKPFDMLDFVKLVRDTLRQHQDT